MVGAALGRRGPFGEGPTSGENIRKARELFET